MDIRRVSEEELWQLVEEQGPLGPANSLVNQLSRKRARDHQVYVWEMGPYYFVGPEPDAETEAMLMRLAVARCRSDD